MKEIKQLVKTMTEESYDKNLKKALLIVLEEKPCSIEELKVLVFNKMSGFTVKPDKHNFDIYFNKRYQDALTYMAVPEFISETLENSILNVFTYQDVLRKIIKGIIEIAPQEDWFFHLDIARTVLYQKFHHIECARNGWDTEFRKMVTEETTPILTIDSKIDGVTANSYMADLKIEDVL